MFPDIFTTTDLQEPVNFQWLYYAIKNITFDIVSDNLDIPYDILYIPYETFILLYMHSQCLFSQYGYFGIRHLIKSV